MPTKNLHSEPFDEGTLTKLSIFEDYAQAWIPTFLMSPYYSNLNIFDFFAGTGYDLNNVSGSSIRILKQVNDLAGYIFNGKKTICLYFNELNKDKFDLLQNACKSFIDSNDNLKRMEKSKKIKIFYTNKDVSVIFDSYSKKIEDSPSLIYLDQNGIKFLADEYFSKLISYKQVDFIYFVSSSYFLRFGDSDEFKQILELDMNEARNNPYNKIHKYILEELKNKIPKDNPTRLYPFTIKKGNNIYGIIFGASHPRAVDKFLNITWEKNDTNGEANFDIDDDDFKKDTSNLFFGQMKTKIEIFQEELENKILEKELITNKDVYLYTLEKGHIPTHSKTVLQNMKKKKRIYYAEKSPYINYNKVFKEKKIITYQLLEK